MDRLTADDQLMLWPDRIWPQEVGAVGILDGAALRGPDGEFRTETVRKAVGERLHRVPRLRRRLLTPRRGLGRPLWVDAPDFDLADHVRVAQLPPTADEAELLRTIEGLRRRRLDLGRPPWEMWFLPGLPEGRVGLFLRFHHVLADGIAGVATMGAFLDAAPVSPTAPTPPWHPTPAPASREMFTDNARRHGEAVGRAVAGLAHPAAGLRSLRGAWPMVRGLFTTAREPATSLNRTVGHDRALGVVRAGLDEVQEIAHRHGATVNDVLLAVTAAGLRALLLGRGEPVDGVVLPVYVPVTLRAADQRAEARGNLISQIVVPLPVGLDDPVVRLRRITAETARLKWDRGPSLGSLLRSRLARVVLVGLLERHPVNVETADLPGPPAPLFLAGAPLLEVFPLLNLIGNVTLGVGGLSYAGRFGILAVADPDAVPDLDVFTTAAQDEVRALAAVLPVAAG